MKKPAQPSVRSRSALALIAEQVASHSCTEPGFGMDRTALASGTKHSPWDDTSVYFTIAAAENLSYETKVRRPGCVVQPSSVSQKLIEYRRQSLPTWLYMPQRASS